VALSIANKDWDNWLEVMPVEGERSDDIRVTAPRPGHADLPGIQEKDLDVSLTGNRLTVSGKREEETRREEERFFALERSYGSFSRSFTLPDGVDTDSAQAEMKDGVLTLRLSKKPEVKARKIELKPARPEEKGKAHA
jgi:HSP20 family protein